MERVKASKMHIYVVFSEGVLGISVLRIFVTKLLKERGIIVWWPDPPLSM